ncbi:Asp-tRNA(Asn)/Glu-tRNA(Gln) amidotransferase subunit GatA [Pseudoflavitalea sp. X16]|uniref:Asp-tRNA(Asn)/Glu-tRNA(Gln) amidotransferase subunit GatA n=1 Tax=Paraflavitalea devenefica TaxID=2716334 RepID=UPI0014219D8D|nr:Asp-tRNA(Asn)/Glu-tRNA(Gln) amidotransferase subunit GatA [Paraflavitalea devenefica]NII23731.1 Asp-tRNA(Asn)/Glu-tRNA(Gln) amidotransferase subunit GatA [Paraflavitalea devenefica]
MFTYESITQYHADLLNGATTCVAAVQHFLHNIENNRHLNAYLHVFDQEALQRAATLDAQRAAGKPLGKLHGVVIAIKDVICYKDHPVSAASKILQNFTSLYNATAVERLLAEEAIIIGNTNCDEFAMGSTNENSAHGKVLNAQDETRVPGGSSGGSAVAVQAALCMVSLGSDTGGSVRQPADFCGIVGLKPTYGRISRYGLIAYASSFDQIGIFANNVPDVALTLEVMAGPDAFDSTVSPVEVPAYSTATNSLPASLKITYFKEALESPALDNEIRDNILALIDKLRADGHTVEPVDFEYLDYIVPTYYVLTTAEASSNLSRFDGVKYGYRTGNVDKNLALTDFYKSSRSDGFGWEVKRRIMLGTFVLSAGYYDAYFTKAQQVRQLLVEKTNLVFNNFDAIILPTAPSTAFKLGEKMDDPIAMYLADIFTVFSNLTGIPGISIPLFWHSNGMPYGLQIMTNRFRELYLLQLSQQWMRQYRFAG